MEFSSFLAAYVHVEGYHNNQDNKSKKKKKEKKMKSSP
jgi:hypothetical protein